MIVSFIYVFLLVVVQVRGGKTVQSLYLKASLTQSSTVSSTSCLLQKYTVRSKLDCVRRCFGATPCVSLTYTALRPNVGSCVCLAPCLAANSSMTVARGTICINACGKNTLDKASGTRWLSKTCAVDTDCPAQHSSCYAASSTCLCTPGYFYSNSCNTCIAECDSRNLLPAFQEYKNGSLWGYDDITIYYVTRQKCEAMCAGYTWCVTFDYKLATTACYLSHDTAITSQAFTSSTSNYYQRMCF